MSGFAGWWPAAQILPEVPGVSMEVAASDSSSDDGSIASSPSGKASSAEVAATHSTTAASSGHAARVQALADKLSLIRARKSSLLVRLGDLKRVWKSEDAYVQSRRRSRNSLRALRGVSRASSCICVWGTHSRPASQKLFR
ncbi:glycosyltransferase family 28 protein [Toxoplasma gondii ARI]|uniref:Glycosyltransferase family 28 protein n=1 Tax=Toxoplasma gondii ARI TaxID=1074872 RepID=A0A139YBI1_TOXGO|nr:glycosyltransferase family 28 protein [Toxoplasma gondii ARI]